VGLELGLVVVHAIFSCKGLDQILERHVTPDIVTYPDGTLNLPQQNIRRIISCGGCSAALSRCGPGSRARGPEHRSAIITHGQTQDVVNACKPPSSIAVPNEGELLGQLHACLLLFNLCCCSAWSCHPNSATAQHAHQTSEPGKTSRET
jgi:hypothetical protein